MNDECVRLMAPSEADLIVRLCAFFKFFPEEERRREVYRKFTSSIGGRRLGAADLVEKWHRANKGEVKTQTFTCLLTYLFPEYIIISEIFKSIELDY